jgi:hypothetical protein
MNMKLDNGFSDYEYVNRNSGRTIPSLILALVIGLAFIVGAVLYWKRLADWEMTGDTIEMSSYEHLLYKLGGKWLCSGLLLALGVVMIVGGVKQYRRREKLKNIPGSSVPTSEAPV